MVDFKKLSVKLQAHLTPPDAESKIAPAEGATCTECVMGSPIYVPCGKPAEYVIENRNERNPMCAMCADHNVRNRGASYMRKSDPAPALAPAPAPAKVPPSLPEVLPGHWKAKDGHEMALRYATMVRSQLIGGDSTDMLVAFEIASLRRDDDHRIFEPTLAMAKDRIRWLSVQLAIANQDADRGLRIQIDTMTALAAARERQFGKAREVRDDLLAALQGCIAFRNWQLAKGGVTPPELIDTWKRAEAAIAKASGGK